MPAQSASDGVGGGNAHAAHWALEPGLDFLNHGSFGACPTAVLAVQAELRARLERQPVQFLARELADRLDAARERLAAFLAAQPEDLVWVPNATTGVSTVVRSLPWSTGDELLTTEHAYNACRNALDVVAAASGARVVTVAIPFPGTTPEAVVAAVLAAVTPRTRLALLDHVTSPTALVLPVAELVSALAARGVDTLVDGAHAPGMLPLALDELAAAYYTGNCHKWMSAPKGAAFLWVRRDRQAAVRPLVVSHGHNRRRPGRSRFQDELDQQGTDDPTAYLTVPAAIDYLGGLLPGGWPALRERNRRLAVTAQAALARAFGVPVPAPPEMIGSMATVPFESLTDAEARLARNGQEERDAEGYAPLAERLRSHHRIEIPLWYWPWPRRVVRFSAQLYNHEGQVARLIAALAGEVAAGL
jgi:isopenicillin-N epimerase